MATRSNVPTVIDNSADYAVYTWTGLLNGDVGDSVDIGGWAVASVEWEGTAGAGFAGASEISNNPVSAPTQWNVLTALAATAAGFFSNATGLLFGARFRPAVTAGDGTTSMTCRLLLVK